MSQDDSTIPVSLIGGSLLPTLMNHVFPGKTKDFKELSTLLPDYKHDSNQRRGIWLVREDQYLTKDECGWFVIHWPSLTRNLLANPGVRQLVAKLDPMLAQRFPVESRSPEAFEAQWMVFRDWLRASLPPGSLLWAHHEEFQRLTRMVPPEAAQEAQFSIFRAGCLLSHKYTTLPQRFEAFRCFTQIGRIHEKIFDRLPTLLQLILDVLREARDYSATYNGFDQWGIAWCNQGLALDGVRALMRAKEHSRLHEKYIGDIYETYLSHWLSPVCLEEKPNLPKIPALHKYIERREHYTDRALVPYTTAVGDWEIKKTRVAYAGRHIFFCPFGQQTNLKSIVEQLIKLSDVIRDKHTISLETAAEKHLNFTEKHVKKVRKLIEPPKKKLYKHVVPIILDMTQLGYYDTKQTNNLLHYSPMSMSAVQYNNTYFISFPDVLSQCFNELNDAKYFKRRKDVDPDTWQHPLDASVVRRLNVERASLLEHEHATCFTDGTLYLNPKLLLPDEGEAISFLNSFLSVHPAATTQHKAYVEVLNNFFKWLYTPQVGLEEGLFGIELEAPLKAKCPVKLDTLDTRLQFLIDKGRHIKSKAVASMPSPGKDGPRSPRLNSYDKFLLWYVLQYEIPELPVILNKREYCEYLCSRWMYWRRPTNLESFAAKPEYSREKLKACPTLRTSKYNARQLVTYANNKFGKPFTNVD